MLNLNVYVHFKLSDFKLLIKFGFEKPPFVHAPS